jgi:poly(A) polymerase
MLRRILGKVFPGFKTGHPRIIGRKAHGIVREHISRGAAQTCETLQRHGYAAYVVGGAVRDLVLKRDPKDYDVATSATPEQVRALFRRSRIIGRRFQLVHVLFGPEVIEVATFRGNGEAEGEVRRATDEHGRILRDNVFGSVEDDAKRRDFTVNALFYDPMREEVLDYIGGFPDLKARRLRMIGEPVKRYREDPIRMLRAVRLSAARDLEIDPPTRKPIRALADLLQNVPQARVFDEMMKLLLSGHATEAVKRLRKEGLHHGLLPMLDVILEQPLGERFVMSALANTDARINDDKPVSPGFLFAALLWHEVLNAWNKAKTDGMKTMPALFHAMDSVSQAQGDKLAIPRRFSADMKEIWSLQPRFENRSGRRPLQILEHPRFRAAYDFLTLRCASGELPHDLGEWWEKFQRAAPEARAQMLLPQSKADGKRRRRPRRRKSAAPAAATQ